MEEYQNIRVATFADLAGYESLGRIAYVVSESKHYKFNGVSWFEIPVQAFPVGSVYIAVVSTNPATLLGYGTWSAFATGRTLVGIDAGQAEFDVVEETGGAKTHTLQTSEIPAHSHVQNLPTSQTGGQSSGTRDTSTNGSGADALSTANAGGGGAHNNLQPYIVVYMWKRTA